MITIKSAREIETMAAAGRIVAETLALVGRNVRPDITTDELDQLAESFIRSHPGAQPSFKGLYDFPATLCTSISQEIVHGMTIAIEPMINVGGAGIRTLDDKWTVVTQDGSLSAHFEHTVAIGENGAAPRILTAAD